MTNEQLNTEAAKAMGWKIETTDPKYRWIVINPDGFQVAWSDKSESAAAALPNFTATYDGGASLLVAALAKEGWGCTIMRNAHSEDRWLCLFSRGTENHSDIGPHDFAITRAFLKVKGILQ